MTGELTAWDADGIDGSFGRREWVELDHEDVWRLYRQLIDANAPRDWIDVGRTMLLVTLDQPRAERYAEQAFRRALELDPDAEKAVADAREEAADEARLRAEKEAAAEAERLHTDSPEARPWHSRPWPELSEEQQDEAVATMREDAAEILERAGMELEPVETDFFLFYSDMPRREARRWVRELDVMYEKLAERFDLPKGHNIFWGKAVIFVFNHRDRFRLVEAEAFGHLAPEWVDGLCHPMGPKVFVSFYRRHPDEVFAAVLVHETVHGFMHRYRTPRRLPAWANEGFCDYLASVLFRNSPVDLERRKKGLRFIRGGGDVGAVLDMSYGDGSWPGAAQIGYSIGYLLVELMVRDRPRAFGRWVTAIKSGKGWEQALEEDFGVDRTRLIDTFVRYYRVND